MKHPFLLQCKAIEKTFFLPLLIAQYYNPDLVHSVILKHEQIGQDSSQQQYPMFRQKYNNIDSNMKLPKIKKL